jgi:phenylalanine-4-hydroxylase
MDTPSLVVLDRDHPGFRDPVYRARRDAIARAALAHRDGDPPPRIEYTEAEHGVWSVVWNNLAPVHDRYACSAWFEGDRRLRLPRERVPQFAEVNDQLLPMTGFCLMPVAGLVTPGAFLRELGRGVFLSTQYMRHASAPLYTPEPDVVHEVLGHANQLADPDTARLYRLVGDAVHRVETDAALRLLSRVFWFTFEFGVVEEHGELKTYGAGILSSFGELDAFRTATILPLDFAEMARVDYDITKYQPVLFAARSMIAVHDLLDEFLTSFTDDTPRRLSHRSSVAE